ncbi:MAG: hemerythrin family protein [Rhodoferax sp.]|nr:hemerythrin family protein [Rhodoferax sp.]
MPKLLNVTDLSHATDHRAKGEVVYRIEGRVLRTNATGPFNSELVAAIPHDINDLLIKLTQQGKWGQIVTFERNAYTTPAGLAEFTEYLKSRYQNSVSKPVTALVFGPQVAHGREMAPDYFKCYDQAGVECCIFEDFSTAQVWVKSKIRQISEVIQWREAYKIGDAAIDEQHQELFLRAGDVIAATNRESQTLSSLRLYQFMRSHFSHEEELMYRIGYPEIKAHIEQHTALTVRLKAFLKNISNDNLIKAELEDFIAHWLLDHIGMVDSKLAAYLKHQP